MAPLAKRLAALAALFVMTAVLLVPVTSEPITPCEEDKQKLADRTSCTRYHVCREESPGIFTSDIAVCSTQEVFDLVNKTCVDAANGYLQDPEGCKTFYGCSKPTPNSEGFDRSHYTCPGDLRFHPTLKHCTFKTSVPDTLCNSNMPSQQILESTTAPITTTPTPTTTEDTTTGPTTTITPAPTEADASTDSTDTATPTAAPTTAASSSASPPGVRNTVPRPLSDLTDIQRITQVIQGQLLNRKKQAQAEQNLKASSRA
ncbi:platelet glycoprotein Ib alpha chain-like [Penaeus japonicus]|uniref:platelet glycoprotein Ib alpha chain-like n=1 Tax=Penaeus japonicus TaxID=27405 RepID=UPI001C70F580|nr:platelet glycoprotein Ib alpha chain-like [Penaeus japonicus]XP_042872485.1 platelet glycoprotein Ib alpha chain-like [Penaeus japonicus]